MRITNRNLWVGFSLIFFFTFQALATSQSDGCIEVRTPLEVAQCRALPDTKKYFGGSSEDPIRRYSCEYECMNNEGELQRIFANHQSPQINSMNALLCDGVSLDMVDLPGYNYKGCKRTVKNFSILESSNPAFNDFLKSHRFFVPAEHKSQLRIKLINELRKIAEAYLQSGFYNQDMKVVGLDLTSFIEYLENKNPSKRDLFLKYLELASQNNAPIPYSKEYFVLVHVKPEIRLIKVLFED